MASIFRDLKGNQVIQFVAADGRRRSIFLAKERKRTVDTVKVHLEELVAAHKAGSVPYDETSEWVGRIGVQLHRKLVRAGLVLERASGNQTKLKVFLDGYVSSRGDAQPNTVRNLQNSCRRLVDHFGADKPLNAIL